MFPQVLRLLGGVAAGQDGQAAEVYRARDRVDDVRHPEDLPAPLQQEYQSQGAQVVLPANS